MIFDHKRIAMDTMQKALTLRKRMGFALWVPLGIFDFTQKIGIIANVASFSTLSKKTLQPFKDELEKLISSIS
ncbi:MAG: hypothetical protein JXB88_14985 [Spirochaetales bacterium]|nr:hypothetical protein [Spirochaetales bacterium]